jgi:pimeloyl-ACP methyl ester carboxylesterase
MRLKSTFLIALALVPSLSFSSEAYPVKKFELGSCSAPWLPKDARCGTYEVWENRAAKSGRKIPLQVVVLPATGPKRLPDPLVYFAGGPGASSIGEGVGFATSAPELRKDRDFLLIDNRGTGANSESAPLACPELEGTGGLQGFLENFMPADRVRACRDRLRKTVDLTQYSSDYTVDDAEEIRKALGYGKVNVMGTSYGTRTVQVYMRRHPRSVRTAVMSGVLPVSEAFPLVTARYAQQALDNLIVECAGDPACGKAFPKLREEVAAVLRRVEGEPVKLRVLDPETAQPIDFTLSKNGLAQVLRRMLYYNPWISLTPLYLHLAANGDWQPLAEMVLVIGGGQSSLGGYFLAITCSEDLAFVLREDIPAAVAGTFLGDLRVRKQLEACEGWPAPKLGPEFRTPVTSDIPTLLLSGGADPVTPPSSGDQVARYLKRSRHIVVEDGGHGLDGMSDGECVPRMVTSFITTGSAESMDASCAAGMRRPDFLLSLDPEVKLNPEELARLAGIWVDKNGTRFKTEVVGGYLRAVSPNGQTLMAATSPTRFRLRSGEPWLKLSFNLQDGHAVSMTVEDPGGTQIMTRETAAPASQVEWKPCTLPWLPKDARCGVYEVWENRAAKSGRKIPLQVVVLPATGPQRQPDPLVYFAGGPGGSAIGEGAGYASGMPELRKERDILLIDARGIGESAALDCPELGGTGSLQGLLEDFMPAAKVRACRDRLQKTADLTQYSNDSVVDDTEEIRTALGYGKVNLMGTSYGARPVQVYLRRHPGSVRSAVVISPVPIDEIFPLVTARHSQRALDLLIAECEGDPACGEAFPKLREEVAAVLRRIVKETVKVRTVDAETGQPVDLTLSKNGFGQVLRRMLYYNNWISLTPLYLHLAANGDWRPLAEMAPAAVGGQSSLGGHFLSITCSEDLPFVREGEIPAAVAGTFLGDLRVRKQLEVCEGWPAPKLGPEFPKAVTSDVPALILSGEVDPVTPPSSGDRVARGLKRGRHIVVPDAGHGLDGMEGFDCLLRMVSSFFIAGSAESLDTSCVAGMRRPGFLLSLDPEVQLKPEELARVTGTWLGREGLKVRTEAVNGYLRVAFPNGNVLLAATSPTSFRRRGGEPGFLITFDVQDGRAVSMTLREGDGTQTLKREGS